MKDFYHRDQPFIQRVMNQHEIDKAILHVRGPRDFNPSIRKIWDRLLKKPTGRRRINSSSANQPGFAKKRNSKSFYDSYNRGFRDGVEAVLKMVELAGGNSSSEIS